MRKETKLKIEGAPKRAYQRFAHLEYACLNQIAQPKNRWKSEIYSRLAHRYDHCCGNIPPFFATRLLIIIDGSLQKAAIPCISLSLASWFLRTISRARRRRRRRRDVWERGLLKYLQAVGHSA